MDVIFRDPTHARETLVKLTQRLGRRDTQQHAAQVLWTIVDNIFLHPHCLTVEVYQALGDAAIASHPSQGKDNLLLAWHWLSAAGRQTPVRHYDAFLPRWFSGDFALDGTHRNGWRRWLDEACDKPMEDWHALREQWQLADQLVANGDMEGVRHTLARHPFELRVQILQSQCEALALGAGTPCARPKRSAPRL